MSSSPEERELIARCLKGDDGAFRKLVEEHHLMVYRLAYQILRDPHEAEDLTQEVFVHVYKRLKDFRGESKFSSWLYRVAYRLGLNFRRDLKLERRDLFETMEEMPATDSSTASMETREEVDKILEKLPAHDRLILTLFYLDEKSIAEISEALEITESAVKVRLHRIRAQFHA